MGKTKKLTKLLGIRYPLVLGGMVHLGKAELAAAFSEAGGLGQLAAGGLTPEALHQEIRKMKGLTSKPFGVNISLGRNVPVKRQVEILEKEKVQIITLGGGNPLPYIPVLKEKGFKVITVIGTPYHALRAQEAGADFVVAEGFEAGGHGSPLELTTLTLVSCVVDIVDVPVIAAGGIMDGRGMVAVLALGAAAAQMGTRFMATEESPLHPSVKEALVKANEQDGIVLGRRFGRVLRVLKTPLAEKLRQKEQDGNPWEEFIPYVGNKGNLPASLEGDLSKGIVFTGQGVGAIKKILPAGQVIKEIIEEAQELVTGGFSFAGDPAFNR